MIKHVLEFLAILLVQFMSLKYIKIITFVSSLHLQDVDVSKLYSCIRF